MFSHSYLAVSVDKICAVNGLRVGVYAIVGRIPFTSKQQSFVHFQQPAMFWDSKGLISLEADVFRSGINSRIRLCFRLVKGNNTVSTTTKVNRNWAYAEGTTLPLPHMK